MGRRGRRLPVHALLLLVIAGCAPQQEGEGDDAAGSMLTRVPAAERQAAPDLAGSTLDGADIRLSDYRGQVVVLNVWASWCGPCRAEVSALSDSQRELGSQGVQVLGVDTEVQRDKGRAFQREHDLAYPSLHDPGSRKLSSLPRGYARQALPYTLFIDRKGRIAATYVSTLTEADVRDITRPYLAERAQ